MKAEVELAFDADLGEGPVWDNINEELYWVDVNAGKLFIYDPESKENKEFNICEHVGAVALRENGGLVMALKSGFAFYNLKTETIRYLQNPESNLPGNRFNDGKCDPSGRFWAGSMSYELKEGEGNLYCLNKNLSPNLKLENLTISNGMGWNSDVNRFFFIDTPTQKIFSFIYDDASGAISNRKTVCEIDQKNGSPDGMTIDEENHLWVALYNGGKVIRINPENGEVVFEVELPVPLVTSCTFGGRNMNELYITTAKQFMTEEELEVAPLSGSLFKVKLPFKGRPAVRFKG